MGDVTWMHFRKKFLIQNLKKATYGIKQAHIACYNSLCSELKKYGFTKLPSAPCVFRMLCSKFEGELLQKIENGV